jgi:hypothetical protein
MISQVSLMKMIRHLATSTVEKNTEWVRAKILDYQWVTINEMAHHLSSAMVLYIESSTTDLGFIKLVQDGFQNNSQESTSTIIWQSAKIYWTTIATKMMPFWDALSLGMRRRCTIMFQKANSRVWNGNILHHQSKSSSKLNHVWEAMLTLFWDTQGPTLEHYQKRGMTVNSEHYASGPL